MKKQIQMLVILLFVMGIAFAHDKKISCNGVVVPDWMMNCAVLKSDVVFGSGKCIGDIFGTPSEGTKIKKVMIEGDKLHLEYFIGEKPSEAVIDATFDFVCAKIGSAGSSYVSHVKFISRLTFDEIEVSCKSPNDDYRYGKCMGTLYNAADLMFVDEEKVAREKAEAEERLAREKANEEERQRRIEEMQKEKEKEAIERRNRKKEGDYKIQLMDALTRGEVAFGFTIKCFKYKQNALAAAYLGTEGKLVVDKVDSVMSKLGFQKGDVIEGISGLKLRRHSNSQEANWLFAQIVSGEYDQSALSSMLVESENDVITFGISRKGKQMSISAPKFNEEQLGAFKERFEKEWDEKNPIENFIK